MRQDVKLLLLKLVKHNGNLQPIVRMGFTYSQIGILLEDLVSEGLIDQKKSSYVITLTGEKEILELNKHLNRFNSAQWIEPATEFKIVQINKNDVFLPDQDDLSF